VPEGMVGQVVDIIKKIRTNLGGGKLIVEYSTVVLNIIQFSGYRGRSLFVNKNIK